MAFGARFFISNILLGFGLAMDAFSVSLANGLNEPCMKKHKMIYVAGIFAVFQGLMPMIGWICVHSVLQYFSAFEIAIPWIALGLLCWIGGNMIFDSLKNTDGPDCCHAVCFKTLMVQGIATSIDALSVGFTIAGYDFFSALTAVLLITVVTYMICFCGLVIGKKVGTKLAGKAGIFGGVILILIGIEIFISNHI